MCDAEDIGEGLQYKHCGCAHIGDSWIVIERQRGGGLVLTVGMQV